MKQVRKPQDGVSRGYAGPQEQEEDPTEEPERVSGGRGQERKLLGVGGERV